MWITFCQRSLDDWMRRHIAGAHHNRFNSSPSTTPLTTKNMES
jgi:hypothetical protein